LHLRHPFWGEGIFDGAVFEGDEVLVFGVGRDGQVRNTSRLRSIQNFIQTRIAAIKLPSKVPIRPHDEPGVLYPQSDLGRRVKRFMHLILQIGRYSAPYRPQARGAGKIACLGAERDIDGGGCVRDRLDPSGEVRVGVVEEDLGIEELVSAVTDLAPDVPDGLMVPALRGERNAIWLLHPPSRIHGRIKELAECRRDVVKLP